MSIPGIVDVDIDALAQLLTAGADSLHQVERDLAASVGEAVLRRCAERAPMGRSRRDIILDAADALDPLVTSLWQVRRDLWRAADSA